MAIGDARLVPTDPRANRALMTVRYDAAGRMRVIRADVDPERDKQNALKLAAHIAKRVEGADRARANAIRLAAPAGASLREISSATGLSHMTVKRILERQAGADAEDE